MKMEPGIGMVARCSRGALGLITSDKPEEITYPDGNIGVAWTGIQLSWLLSEPGKPWSSRNPKVIGHLSKIIMDAEV